MPALNFLLEQACPSIQYRLRREILGENPFAAPMQELQARVLLDPEVQRVGASQQPDELAELLRDGQGFFTRRLSHPCFHAPDTYGGLRLEADWRASQRRVNDLTFSSLLILHYTDKG